MQQFVCFLNHASISHPCFFNSLLLFFFSIISASPPPPNPTCSNLLPPLSLSPLPGLEYGRRTAAAQGESRVLPLPFHPKSSSSRVELCTEKVNLKKKKKKVGWPKKKKIFYNHIGDYQTAASFLAIFQIHLIREKKSSSNRVHINTFLLDVIRVFRRFTITERRRCRETEGLRWEEGWFGQGGRRWDGGKVADGTRNVH